MKYINLVIENQSVHGRFPIDIPYKVHAGFKKIKGPIHVWGTKNTKGYGVTLNKINKGSLIFTIGCKILKKLTFFFFHVSSIRYLFYNQSETQYRLNIILFTAQPNKFNPFLGRRCVLIRISRNSRIGKTT